MGAAISSMYNSNKTNKSEKQFENFYHIVNTIATEYILTMDFKSLSKLSETEYCNKLVILTSDIFDRYFNELEVTYLEQQFNGNNEINKMVNEKLRFFDKDRVINLDISNGNQKTTRKKRACIGIAKFYVKIAHIFAAIITTINPVYTYKDATGQTVKVPLLNKNTIPKDVVTKVHKINICDNRIKALKKVPLYINQSDDEMADDNIIVDKLAMNNNPTMNNNQAFNNPTMNKINQPVNNLDSNMVTIQPRICDMNATKTGVGKTLADEPGIPELRQLYLDETYDYSNGQFKGMSKESDKMFNTDLKVFYTAFTGETQMPENNTIKQFSDIKLRDYNKYPGCQSETPFFKQPVKINKNHKLFIKYADNITKMIQRASNNQQKLLEVINDLFKYVKDPYSNKRVIIINPKLTDELLTLSVRKTRKFIIDLYVNCEIDYFEGVKIFQAIVETKIIETTQKQIETLKKESNKLIYEFKSPKIIRSVVINPPIGPTGFNTVLNTGPTGLNTGPTGPTSINQSVKINDIDVVIDNGVAK